MYRLFLTALFLLQACQIDAEEATNPFDNQAELATSTDQLAPPGLTLTGPGALIPGSPATFVVTGPLNPGERVFFGLGMGGVGLGPCPPALGGQCLGILPTLRIVGTANESGGSATLTVMIPPTAPIGATVGMQTAAVRGPGGSTSILSNAIAMTVSTGVAPIVEMHSGDIPFPTSCAAGDFECQAEQVCEGVTGTDCIRQDYDCATGVEGSYYPVGTPGGSTFNFAITYDFPSFYPTYGNICCCDQAMCDSYSIRQDHSYCGTGHWNRVQ